MCKICCGLFIYFHEDNFRRLDREFDCSARLNITFGTSQNLSFCRPILGKGNHSIVTILDWNENFHEESRIWTFGEKLS